MAIAGHSGPTEENEWERPESSVYQETNNTGPRASGLAGGRDSVGNYVM